MELRINKKLLPVKAHYFLLNGAQAGVITFIPVYAQQLGISSSAVGIILAILCCVTVITRASFGGIVDYFQKLKQVLLFLIFLDVVAVLGLNFIPRPYQTPVNASDDNFFCHEGSSYYVNFNKTLCELDFENFTEGCHFSCSMCQPKSAYCLTDNDTFRTAKHDYHIKNFLNLNLTENEQLFIEKCLPETNSKCTDSCFDGSEICESITGTNPSLQLWLLSLFVALVYVSNGSIVSLSDAACFNALGDRPQNYGKQRLWGTVGWGICAFITGYLNQVFTGSSKIYSYSSGFYMLIVLFTVDLLAISKLRLENVSLSKNIFKDVLNVLFRPNILVFILAVFGIGVTTGISRAYLFWYMRTTLGASQFIIGCVSLIQCFLGELPFFFFSGFIIQKIGHINTFTMSFLAYGMKFLGHSLLKNPWWALPIELLQGPSFGSFYAAMTSYSKMISPDGTQATVQGLVSGTFEGLGVATGSLLAGFSIGLFGGRETFFWAGVISIITGLLHWTLHSVINCIRKFHHLQNRAI